MLGGFPLTEMDSLIPADGGHTGVGGKNTGNGRRVIGLTGKMCSGKNVAAEILEKHGFAVIDADKAAHRALEESREKVFEAFSGEAEKQGLKIRNEDGSVNRRELGKLLFSKKELLAVHEGILYPRINKILKEFTEENKHKNVVINAPLLFKSDAAALCDFVIIIEAPAVQRFFRALKRDRLGVIQILRRFSSQKALFAQNPEENTDIVKVDNCGGKILLERKLLSVLACKGIKPETPPV